MERVFVETHIASVPAYLISCVIKSIGSVEVWKCTRPRTKFYDIVKMKFLFIHGMRNSKWHRSHREKTINVHREIHFHASTRRMPSSLRFRTLILNRDNHSEKYCCTREPWPAVRALLFILKLSIFITYLNIHVIDRIL